MDTRRRAINSTIVFEVKYGMPPPLNFLLCSSYIFYIDLYDRAALNSPAQCLDDLTGRQQDYVTEYGSDQCCFLHGATNTICNHRVSTLLTLEESHSSNEATLDLYSLGSKTSYLQIARSLEAARLGEIMILSLCNLVGIGSGAAVVPVKSQSGWKMLYPNLSASRLRKILRWDVRPVSE